MDVLAEHWLERFDLVDDPRGWEWECRCGQSGWQRRQDLSGEDFRAHVAEMSERVAATEDRSVA